MIEEREIWQVWTFRNFLFQRG